MAWDARTAALLARLAYWQALAASYAPSDIFAGQILLLAQGSPTDDSSSSSSSSSSSRLLAAADPGRTWQSIAMLLQPVEVHAMPACGASTAAASAHILAAALLAAAQRAGEAEASTPEAAAVEHGSSMLLTPRQPVSPAPFSPPVDSDTASVVLPLNRLCPERRYILRRSGRSGTPSALLAPPLARLPLWLVHGETGSVTGALKELAADLALPCYGLAMGGDVANCATLAELAAHYVAAITAVQPRGPYLLAGCSLAGAAVAHAAAVQLQAGGQRVALLMLDGCLGQPLGLPLHDTTW